MNAGAQHRAAAPMVTVVVPVRNEGEHIGRVLEDLRAQDYPPDRLEILVLDGRSTDDTRERVNAYAAPGGRIRLLDNPGRLSSAARALGAEAARGTYIVYVDGHCRIPSRTLLRDMVALFETSGADCLARPQPLLSVRGGARARAIAAARASPFGHSTQSEIYGSTEGPVSPVSSGAMYKRSVFETVGTFDPAFDACEDVEFNWRVEQAGLLSWSSPKLALAYEPRATYSGLWRQMVRYGIGRARLHRKHPRAFSLESLVPVAFVLGLAPLAVAPLLPAPLGLLVAAPYALYALLAIVFAAVAAARAGGPLLPLILLAFPILHVGLGVGYLLGRARRFPPGATAPRSDGENAS